VDLYQILDVAHDATAEEIRAAYLKLRSSAHPDKQGDAAQFIRIQKAYDVLSDEQRRMEYDATGNTDAINDSKAQTTLIEMLVSTINNLNPDAQDPLIFVRNCIVSSWPNIQAMIKKFEANISRQEKFIKRITRKNGKENFLTQSLQHGIELMRKQIAECVQQIALGEEMLIMLKEFEYDLPQQPSMQAAWFIDHKLVLQPPLPQGESP
jgi:curved DNA-binding protein CbpA